MYDYVIIGGGISGLYMYLKLLSVTKNIILFEKNNYFGGRIFQYQENFNGNNISLSAGAARFNKKHIRVIQLLKSFKMLDFRKDKGIGSSIDFIDSTNQFHNKFKNKNGFHYIKKVLKFAKNKDKNYLMQFTFSEFSQKFLKKDELEFMLIASGYTGQLLNMNMFDAYHLFSNGIRDDLTFYVGYYHDLIEKIVKYISTKGANLNLNTNITSVSFNQSKNLYCIRYTGHTIYSKNVIFCLPKPALLKFNIFNHIKHILNDSITCKPLCRVYAKFHKDDVWFKNIKKTVTNNHLRYIIPIDHEKGIIMISYTDHIYTKFWDNLSQSQLKQKIVNLVNKTFNININQPEKVWVFNWDCGVGYWNKDIDSEYISQFISNPLPNLYICGENYSLTQSWVEGALQSCDYNLNKILN